MADVTFNKPVLAKQDCTVTDSLGVRRRIFAGKPVPSALLDAYNVVARPRKAKAQEDSKTTAQDGPELHKADLEAEVRKTVRRRRKQS